MREHILRHIEIYFITLVTVTVIGAIFLLSVASEYIQANAMHKLGYEVKVVNFACYTKQQGRWMVCSSVVNNQIEITK